MVVLPEAIRSVSVSVLCRPGEAYATISTLKLSIRRHALTGVLDAFNTGTECRFELRGEATVSSDQLK